MKQMYLNRINAQERFENGPKTVRVKSRIGSRLVRKSLDSFLTRFCLISLFLILMGGFTTEMWAWRGAKVEVEASGGGLVYAGNSNSAGTYNTTGNAEQSDGWSTKDKTFTFYIFAKANTNYVFKGWAGSNSANSGDTSNPKTVSITATRWGGGSVIGNPKTEKYYAIFARLTSSAGSTFQFGDVVVGEESGTQTLTINHAHAGTVSLSKSGDHSDDFVLSESSFTSVAEDTKNITIKFKPTSNGLRTCTLTVSSDNGLSSLTYVLKGTGYNKPSITWVDGDGNELTSGETTLSVGDVLRASCTTGQTVSYTGYNSNYFTAGTDANGNPILTVKEGISGTINNVSVTGNLAKNTSNYYAAYSDDFSLSITNLVPQTIEWTNDITDISNELIGQTIILNAVAKNAKTGANSGQTISYSMAANSYMSLSGNVLTINNIGGPVAIKATAAGNANYAPTSVTKYATVIDMTTACYTSDSHSNGQFKRGASHDIYPTLPASLTFNARRESSWLWKDLVITQYNANGTQIKQDTKSCDDITDSGTGTSITISCDPAATTIRFAADGSAKYTYYITNITTTRKTESSVTYESNAVTSLSYATDPGQKLGKTIRVSYSNIPVFLSFKSDEDANVSSGKSLWSLNTAHFGGCGKSSFQDVTVSFKSDKKGNYTDKLYVRNNVGNLLHTIDLSATVTAQEQFLKSWNIADTYNTTDQVTLQASTTIDNTNFTFTPTTSNPENIVSISNIGVMTFSGSGTATIQAYQPGDDLSQEFTTTHDITINKVTPTIAENPTVKTIHYLDQFANDQFIDGLATVTLRGEANTEVEGTFAWKNAGNTVTDGVGSHNYSITFTPTDGGMYTNKTFTQSVTISRADGGIEMNDGSVKVKVAGINDNLNECKIDLDNLIDSKITDAINANRAGAVTYEVISDNKANATIDANNVFSATAVGTYTVRATQAQTDYYEEATDEFTVTVNRLTPTIVFDNTDNPEIIYSGDVIETPAYRMYNGHEIDRVVNYKSSDPSITGAIHVDGTTLTARDLTAPEGSAVQVTITASTSEDALYNAASETATHNYSVRAKRSPVFTMEGVNNAPVSKTLNIGEQAVITYNENVDANFTVGTAAELSYITFEHDSEHRTITVTAKKGTLIGDGEQTVTLNQPGNARLFDRNITYTFTVKKNVSALSLAGLTTSMQVEDTVATPYTGSANTEAAVQFTCSPEGSMKMENGKLIALQAGTNTVTFSQPATEYWTGVSQSKTITVSRKNPNITTELGNRHAWYSIIEHPFKSLNTEKELQITSSNDNLAKYVATEDKIYVYGTSGSVTFTVNQEANYKYNAVVNYQKTFTIFQPNNRLPMTLTSSNLSDYNGGSAGGTSWDGDGVVVGSASLLSKATDWSAKYIILKFVGVPDKLSFNFENTIGIATQYGWHFYQSSNGKDWNLIKEYQDLLMNATGGTSSGSESNLQLDPATRYVKLEYHGNYGGRFKNVKITERKEIVPQSASTDFGLGYNGNDPTARTIKVDWYNVQPCTVTIINDAEGRFELAEGSNVINSLLDNCGTAELVVRYKHDVNTATQHTATLHIQSQDGKTADVALSGQTTPAPQTIIWRSDLTPMPIEGSFSSAAYSTSGLDITLTSLNPGIVTVGGDDNLTLTPVTPGTAYVCAYQAGNEKWAQVAETLQIVVTSLKVQQITWDDQLSNRKHEEGKSETITLSASSSANLPITYTLDAAAQQFATITGNTLTLTGWGKGTVTAHQIGNEEYVAVEKSKTLVSRNPSAGCNPLVGEYASEYTLHTLAEKEIELDGEPGSITFWAKCDASALYGLWVAEYYDGYWHDVKQINRLDEPGITSTDTKFGPYNLNIKSTKVKLYTKTGATMTRTFHNVEVTLAKYLSLQDNPMDFSQVDKGSTKPQSFYINYSNLTGVLDVEMQNKTNTQFEVLTTTVGEDCGDAAKSARIDIQFTGSTLGTENNTIIVSNKDQRLEIPVSATVVLPTQAITWNPALNIFTTDQVQLVATATSEFEVTFTSNNSDIAEPYRRDDGTWWLNIHSYGSAEIVAHQPGDNESWGAATDKPLMFHISRVVPEIDIWPTAQITLPNTLAAATLTGGEAPDGILGSFSWEDESQTVTRQAHTFNVVFVPDNTDYYAPVSHPLELEILKTPQTITWSRADESDESCAATIILDATASSGLPITYTSSDETKAYIVDAVINEVPVMKLYVLKGGDVTITASQSGDDTYDVAPSVEKKITLIRVIPTIETLPTATDMYVHHFLSNSTPEGGVVKAGENTVTGVFNWQDGSDVMDVPGTNQRTVVFHPYNSDYYQTASAVIDVEVKRFAPTITSTINTDSVVYGTPLSGITMHGTVTAIDQYDPAHPAIQGTWTWKLDPQCVLGVADQSTRMVFHPTRQDWYDDVEFDVPLTITINNDFTPTATATIIYGQTLSEAVFVSTTVNPIDNSQILTGNFQLGIGLDPNACYDEGEHTVTIAMQVTSDDNFSHDWKEGKATLTVLPGLIYNGTDGVWNDGNNWIGGVPDGDDRVTIDANVDVVGNVTVTALTINAGKTVTIKNGATLTVGANNSFQRDTYGDIHVEEGGKLVLTTGTVDVNNLYLDASLGNNTTPANSGQIRNVEQIDVNGDAYFELNLDPAGCSYGCYDFVVPFPVDNRTGISRYQGGEWRTDLRTEQHYVILTYHEEIRANNQYAWKKYYGIMQPGVCYSISVNNVAPRYRFRKVKDAEITANTAIAMTASDGTGGNIHKGWNSVGNGTFTHAKISADGMSKVQIYDHATNTYKAIENFGSQSFPVGTAVFVQIPASTDMNFADVNTTLSAPMRTQGRTLEEYLLTFGRENDAINQDRLYLSASENAENSYEIGHDLAKFGTSTTVAQIWADAYGQKLCDVEAPLVDDQAIIPISLYAAQTGTYTLDVARGPQDASLYLMYEGAVVWNLSQSAYTLDLTRGTTTGYSLLLTAEAPSITTGSDTIEAETNHVEKIILNGKLYILRDGQMYDATGKKVK